MSSNAVNKDHYHNTIGERHLLFISWTGRYCGQIDAIINTESALFEINGTGNKKRKLCTMFHRKITDT